MVFYSEQQRHLIVKPEPGPKYIFEAQFGRKNQNI